MQFRYIVFTKTGQMVTGVTEAPSEQVAEEALWRAGYIIAKMEAVRPLPSLRDLLRTLFAVKRQDLIIFSRQLATLLGSGVAILPALQLLADQVGNPTLRRALRQIAEDIQAGASFSEALARHPRVFPVLYQRMIQVGERTGQLEGVLRQLVVYMSKEEAVTRRITAAMIYPSLILALAAVVVTILITVALPAILGLYRELNVELPWTTRALMAISDFVQSRGILLLMGLILLVAAISIYISQPTGRWQFHYLLLHLPVLGPVNLRSAISRLARTMSTLLRAGLPMAEVMDLLLQTTQNDVLRQATAAVQAQLLAGHGLSQPMSTQRIFPRLLVQMVRVGEETGTLDSNLETLADFYEEEADRAIATMTSLIEPALIIFVGLVVGFIAVSVIMPMYSIMGTFK